MGRQVRMVPADWEHPKKQDGTYQPMFEESYKEAASAWVNECAVWSKQQHADQAKGYGVDYNFYWDYAGMPPDKEYYMPEISAERRTHYQMYETTSEGTPISPVMKTPEKLARWLAASGASTFASMTATYEQWLNVILSRTETIGMMSIGGQITSGVEAHPDVKKV